ncbi:hypothetical protein OCHUTO_0393 [Orientia chuto str. Dubai]|uniref:Outer membrane beta-barrel domain protein n=1 Tax=Orientia chuto str. Dubai TaxID=1359168 RepID=A0A0F3MPW3_9RICK|nr:hypothetical protein [Candidatus Orientia mediorientalis]KJV56629.1 hypothetical protein OCHUTO_0393 [Orientia chuto str. Dubai]
MVIRGKNLLLATVLLLLYSFPSLVYGINDLQENYYFKISAGMTKPKGELNIESAKKILKADFYPEFQELKNAIVNRNSTIYEISLGMYCTRSIRLEVGLQYVSNLSFGGDISLVGNADIKINNYNIGAEEYIPTTAGMIKGYWHIIDLFNIVSVFATGGIGAYGINISHEPMFIVPGLLIGGGLSLSISRINFDVECNYASLSVKNDLLPINSQSLGKFMLHSLYGYNILGSIRFDF